MLSGRIGDLILGSEFEVRTSAFLTPSEQRTVFEAAMAERCTERCFFWGGAPEAERRMAVFVPEWMLAEDVRLGGAFDLQREDALREIIKSGADSGAVSDAVVPVAVSGTSYSELSHRDYLGAVIGLGIERDAIGDIVVTSPSSAVVFLLPPAAKLVTSELCSVGKESVEATAASLPASFRVEHEYEVITETVMSARLDGIVRALCKISREEAAKLVSSGDVSLNYEAEYRTDADVVKGDVISVRGYGKYIYDGDRGVNRRGRLRIDARKYI